MFGAEANGPGTTYFRGNGYQMKANTRTQGFYIKIKIKIKCLQPAERGQSVLYRLPLVPFKSVEL